MGGVKKLKAVGFNPAVGEERTEKVEVPGYEPFEITFLVPGADSIFDLSAAGRDNKKSIGTATIDFIAKNLLKWSLAFPTDRTGLLKIDDPECILPAVFEKIYEARGRVKNSSGA